MRLFAGRKLALSLGAAALVAVIAAVAFGLPAYHERQRRAQLNEAFRNLSDIQVWMDAYYAHHRTYARAGVCGAAVVPADRAQNFTYACVPDAKPGAPAGQTYVATATGKSSQTRGFVFSIDEKKQRATLAAPADWGPMPAAARSNWLEKRG